MTARIAPDVPTAAAWGDRPPPKRMRLISFKPMRKGALVGFANVELPNGLKIDDCPVLTSHGRIWATFPAKPQLGKDGRQILIGGKKQYASILSWPDRATADRWSAAVIELIKTKHPGAL